ncbi:alpha/beta hydrolase [Aureococcus anophagefferens]|nr:alpha/beta hydrolase [Aureococcus anophagefferens]
MLGNGVSSSPSTCAAYPPVVTVDDQARALRRACDAALGPGGPSTPPRLLHGRHAGAGARARGGVAAVVAVCGAAGCSDYNRVFLDALDAALEGGDRALAPALARYAGWGVSYDFYAERAWARLGFEDLDDFLERSYVAGFATDDPDDLRAMLACWRAAAERPPGLEAIEARCLFLPCDTDAPPGVQRSRRLSRAFENHEKSSPMRLARTSEDEIEAREVAPSPARRSTIRSPFGHRAGDPWRDGMDAERAFIRAESSRMGGERLCLGI